ncbi:MAG: FAD-binding oxidoreductase [Acidobacteriota bacterium]
MNSRNYEVIVVGAGLFGCYCAFELASHGLRTLLVERQEVASGASGRGGGLLLKGATDVFSPELVPHLLENQRLLEGFLEQSGQDVEYVSKGSVYVAFEEDWLFTQGEVRRMRDAGLAAELWDQRVLREQLPYVTHEAVGARFVPGDAQLASVKLVGVLADAARRAGVTIWTCTPVLNLAFNGENRATAVQTDRERLECEWVVLATNAYTGHLLPELKSIIVPTRGQAFLTEPLPPAGPFACASNYDLEYWRQTTSGQILFGGCRRSEEGGSQGKGTESTETTPEVLHSLQEAFRRHFPSWGQVRLERAWAGTMGYTPDFKPLIGRVPGYPNLLVTAGCSGNGLPFFCLAGRSIRELILTGRSSHSLKSFAAERFLR